MTYVERVEFGLGIIRKATGESETSNVNARCNVQLTLLYFFNGYYLTSLF